MRGKYLHWNAVSTVKMNELANTIATSTTKCNKTRCDARQILWAETSSSDASNSRTTSCNLSNTTSTNAVVVSYECFQRVELRKASVGTTSRATGSQVHAIAGTHLTAKTFFGHIQNMMQLVFFFGFAVDLESHSSSFPIELPCLLRRGKTQLFTSAKLCKRITACFIAIKMNQCADTVATSTTKCHKTCCNARQILWAKTCSGDAGDCPAACRDLSSAATAQRFSRQSDIGGCCCWLRAFACQWEIKQTHSRCSRGNSRQVFTSVRGKYLHWNAISTVK